MASKTVVAAAVNLLYGAHGRSVHDGMLHAYDQTLREATDYQVEQAVGFLLRNHLGQFPPTAAETLQRAMKYRASEQAERAHLQHNAEQLRIAAAPKQLGQATP